MTWFIAGCIILLFGAVVVRGAPYVPTHRKTIDNALDLMDLEDGDIVLDLGSGDGAFLKAAAKRGHRAIGFEINPLLCLLAWLRCFAVRRHVTISFHDYWIGHFPPSTKAVYVFLAGPYMRRLHHKLQREMAKRTEPLIVVSHGFAIPGYLPKKVTQGLYLYELKP